MATLVVKIFLNRCTSDSRHKPSNTAARVKRPGSLALQANRWHPRNASNDTMTIVPGNVG